jgi:hypothetical protein
MGYPGSTYTLTDDPPRDQLEGIYVQAALQQRFDVMFVRMKSGGIAPSRLTGNRRTGCPRLFTIRATREEAGHEDESSRIDDPGVHP